MRAILTGATGFVGKHLVNELLERNYEVVVIVRNKDKVLPEWNKKVSVFECELCDLDKLSEDISSAYQSDYFFHLAWEGTSGNIRANTDVQLSNVRYTLDALKLAKKCGCSRFINAGSIMEYEAFYFVNEDGAMPGLGNIYSTAKLTADLMAKVIATDYKIDYLNVIISNIYGEGEKSARFFNSTIIKMLKNEDIPLTEGKQLYDFIHVHDAVRLICDVAEKGEKNSSYYIGNEMQRKLKEFILEMKAVTNSQSNLLFGAVPYNGVMLNYNEFDVKKTKELGFEARVSFVEGIQRYVKWIQEEDDGNIV